MTVLDLRPRNRRMSAPSLEPYNVTMSSPDGWTLRTANDNSGLTVRVEPPAGEPLEMYLLVVPALYTLTIGEVVKELLGHPLGSMISSRSGFVTQNDRSPQWSCVRRLHEAGLRSARQMGEWPRPEALAGTQRLMVWAACGFTAASRKPWDRPRLYSLYRRHDARAISAARRYADAGFTGIGHASGWMSDVAWLDATVARGFDKDGWTAKQVALLARLCETQQSAALHPWRQINPERGLLAARAGLTAKETLRAVRNGTFDEEALRGLVALRSASRPLSLAGR